MARFPRMPWYPDDFAGATRGWPLVARGIYRELLDAQWTMGGLPDDEKTLQKIVNSTPAEWRKAWPFVREKFERRDDGQLVNPRLEVHRQEAINLHERKRAGAAKTNRKRWGAEVVPLRGGGGDHD